jgi:hypothetical protein
LELRRAAVEQLRQECADEAARLESEAAALLRECGSERGVLAQAEARGCRPGPEASAAASTAGGGDVADDAYGCRGAAAACDDQGCVEADAAARGPGDAPEAEEPGLLDALCGLDEGLRALLDRHPLAPAEVLLGVERAFGEISAAHRRREDEAGAAVRCSGGCDGGGASNRGSGWTHDEHALFVASRARAHREAAAAGRGAGAVVLERLAVMMPDRSREELGAHEEW